MINKAFQFVFFFSSRRRHTRLVSDWSSDVCSSDLTPSPHWARDRRAQWGEGVRDRLGVVTGDPDRVARPPAGDGRSEERRVGKEGRSRGWAYQVTKK